MIARIHSWAILFVPACRDTSPCSVETTLKRSIFESEAYKRADLQTYAGIFQWKRSEIQTVRPLNPTCPGSSPHIEACRADAQCAAVKAHPRSIVMSAVPPTHTLRILSTLWSVQYVAMKAHPRSIDMSGESPPGLLCTMWSVLSCKLHVASSLYENRPCPCPLMRKYPFMLSISDPTAG
jgi:hypothetical protein